MSFGYRYTLRPATLDRQITCRSLGDVIAFAGLIERIIIEVKSYRSAPEHFQRLALELSFLSQVCSQIHQLEPTSSGEMAHLQRIRAISMQCLGPLREFEEKMRKFDSVLGVDNWKGGSGDIKTSAQRKLECFRKRLHWSMIEKREVDELRAILASEILAINTLLGTQQWETLRTVSSHGGDHSRSLLMLMELTQRAIDDIGQALLGSAAVAAHVQHLIDSNKFNATEQRNLLKNIQANSAKTRSMADKMVKATERQTKQLNGILKTSRKQLARITSVQRYLQGLMESVARYCKEILELVRSNTGILMNLNTMMEKMEVLLANNRLELPYLRFENPFGIEMPLPFVACEVWEGLHNLIVALFTGKPGWDKVLRGQYTITSARNNRILSSDSWSSAVAPGDHIFMSMVLQKLGNGHRCPRCRRLLIRSVGQGSLCESCQLWSSNETVAISIPEAEAFCKLPIPPADPVILHHTRWNGTWRPFSEDSGQGKHARKQTKPRSASHQWQDAQEYVVTNNEDETLYRRVHVLPYQGDVIEGYIAAGKELRLLFLQYVHRDPQAEVDLDALAEDTEAVVEEFEEMLEDGISPSNHIAIRNTRNSPLVEDPYTSPKKLLDTWFNRTGYMLLSVPFGSEKLRSRCRAIGKKLIEPANIVKPDVEVFHPSVSFQGIFYEVDSEIRIKYPNAPERERQQRQKEEAWQVANQHEERTVEMEKRRETLRETRRERLEAFRARREERRKSRKAKEANSVQDAD